MLVAPPPVAIAERVEPVHLPARRAASGEGLVSRRRMGRASASLTAGIVELEA